MANATPMSLMIRSERGRPRAAAAGFSLAEVLIYSTVAATLLAGIIIALVANIRASQRLELKQRAVNLQGRLISLIDNEVREGSEICKGIGCGNPDPEATGSKANGALGVFRSCLNLDPTNSAGVSLNDPTLENMYFTIVIPVSRTMSEADFNALQRSFFGKGLTEIPTLTPTVFGYNNVYVHYAHFTDPASGQESLYRCGPPIKADGSLDIDENAKVLPKAQLTLLHLRTTLTVNPGSFPSSDPGISTYLKGNTLAYKINIYPPKNLGSTPIYKSPQDVIARTSASVVDPTNPAGVND